MYRTRDEFLDAVSSLLEADGGRTEVWAAVRNGISIADESITASEAPTSQAFHLKVGSWIIRDDDVPLFQAINSTAAAVALSLVTAGMPWPAIAAALTSLADVCWRTWRKGGRLSPQQVTVYGWLRTLGRVTTESLLNHLHDRGIEMSAPELDATLRSLIEIELNDGRIVALAAKDADQLWRALKI
jgi:hypothetical protein